jgi:type I restriction enzyme R subunit
MDPETPAREGNRADVMFLVNGVPVAIVEHNNPKDGGAIDRAAAQLCRYEKETPELFVRRCRLSADGDAPVGA